jgi:hypothetical protein
VSRIFAHGLGAVSPAGWGVGALQASLSQSAPLPIQSMPRPGWEKPLAARLIPQPQGKPAFLAHARLRRASPMTHYAVGAALEAMGDDAGLARTGTIRLGIIACTMTGGLSYSRRFYQEVMQDPAMASPLVFPETVFNAPASHLSAYLNASIVSYTLVGDAGTFLQGLAVAAQWLADNVADACVVIGAEELDWTAGDALRMFDRRSIYATGAGALYLRAGQGDGAVAELAAITDSIPATDNFSRDEAARRMRGQLPAHAPDELLCESETANPAWNGWTGARLAPNETLGEAFVASAAWQCVAACDALRRGSYAAANVSITGPARQAIGARFVKPKF